MGSVSQSVQSGLILTRPVTGRSLRIFRNFTQKGFAILVDKELSNTSNLIDWFLSLIFSYHCLGEIFSALHKISITIRLTLHNL